MLPPALPRQKGFAMSSLHNRGFTLIELLVVITIIAVIASVVVILVNPLEIMRKSRDATRLQDLNGIMKSVQLGLQDNAGSTATFLCHNLSAPCTGMSNAVGDMRKNDGTGWVKVNFTGITNVSVVTLPVDPTNDSTYFYTYTSDGTNYEFDMILESSENQTKMVNDGGDNPAVYEIGSALTVIN